MELREFIYIDKPRLNIYVEQIRDPMKKVKVPEWSASLSLKGPSAGAKQKVESRPYTITEKIDILVEYLSKNDFITEGADAFVKRHKNIGWHKEGPLFIRDTLYSTKVKIPRLDGRSNESETISMWLSTAKSIPSETRDFWFNRHGMICLLEDYRGEDEQLFNGGMDSAYSILESILFALNQVLDETVLGEHFPPQGRGNSLEIKSRLDAWWRTPDEYMAKFVKDPSRMLRKMGCVVSRARRIESVFRVRDIGPERGDNRGTTSIFGYPIFIYSV